MLASETPGCLTFRQKTLNWQYFCMAPFIFQYLTKLNWGFLKTDLGHTFKEKRLTRRRAGTGRDGTGLESFCSGSAELLCENLQILRLFSSKKRRCFEIV